MKLSTVRIAAAFASIVVSGPALAQTGVEIVGQPVQVVADGVTDTIYFDTAASARVVTPGNTSVPAGWSAANQQLCLVVQGVQECWPYTAPFQAGVPVTLTSLTTSKPSTWTALSANTAPPPPPGRGERGRR